MRLQTGHDELLCHCGEDDQLNLIQSCIIRKQYWVLRVQSFIVESECRDLLGSLKSSGPCLASYGTLVEDIRLASSVFVETQFIIVPH